MRPLQKVFEVTWLYIPSAYSQAAAGSILESTSPCPLLEPFVTSRGKLLPQARWLRAWKKDPWLRRLSGPTLPPFRAEIGVVWWTSSLADSPAKTFQMLASELDLTEIVPACGGSTHVSLAKSVLHSFSWKTFPHFVLAGSIAFSKTLPRSGTMRNGTVSERQTWALHTDGNEFLSSRSLARVWATPRASMQGVCKSDTTRARADLPRQTSDWATPTARDWKDGANPSALAPTNGLLGRQAPRTSLVGPTTCNCARTLNPVFVEAIMGWPRDWSTAQIASDSSVTEWFRKWRPWLSAFSLKG